MSAFLLWSSKYVMKSTNHRTSHCALFWNLCSFLVLRPKCFSRNSILVHPQPSLRPCATFHNIPVFYGEELQALHQTPKLEDHPLLAVCDCVFSLYLQVFSTSEICSFNLTLYCQYFLTVLSFVLLQYDVQWSLLSLLLHLANNPTASAHLYRSTPTTAEVPEQEDTFDWASYLREGDERFTCVYDDSSSVSPNVTVFTHFVTEIMSEICHVLNSCTLPITRYQI